MIFRNATHKDVPTIADLERIPEFRTYVGAWPEDRHLKMLDDPDTVYLVAEDTVGSIAGFAVLLGLGSEHKSIELKRIVVGAPNHGLGRKLLTAVVEKAFDEHGAHRIWLDVFETNARARHLYETFGFRPDGIFRETVYRDGQYHSLILMSLLDREYRRG